MNNQGTIQLNNGINNSQGSSQELTEEQRNKKALVLREMLGETPTVALSQVLRFISSETVTSSGDNMAQLNIAVCHYAIQIREQLIAAQHELFVARQKANDESEKLETMAQLLEQECRQRSQISAELKAYREHVAEIEALLDIE